MEPEAQEQLLHRSVLRVCRWVMQIVCTTIKKLVVRMTESCPSAGLMETRSGGAFLVNKLSKGGLCLTWFQRE